MLADKFDRNQWVSQWFESMIFPSRNGNGLETLRRPNRGRLGFVKSTGRSDLGLPEVWA